MDINFSLKKLIKKILVITFTDKPYKVRSYNDLFKKKFGDKIDIPERCNDILIYEQGGTIHYPPSQDSIDNIILYRIIGNEYRYLQKGIFKEPDRYLYSISEGCILGRLGVVYDIKNRAYIEESAKEWLYNIRDSIYTNILHFPKKNKLAGITLSCLTDGADGGFYHFFFESLTKIYFCKSILNEIDHFLFNGPETTWKIKWLVKTGIDLNKIKWISNTDHIECEQILFTNRLIADQQISSWCINSLKSLLKITVIKNESTGLKNVIYISRKEFSRSLEWENDIINQYPFIESLELSELNIDETITKMNTATHVIAPHGAGLANIFLCRPGTKVLEFYPINKTFQPCYQRICTIVDLQYSMMYLDFLNKDNKDFGIEKLNSVLRKFMN